MIKKMTVGLAVVAALAAGAPAASADHYRGDCRLLAHRHSNVTGAGYYGVFVAYGAGYSSESVTVSCILTVNSYPVATTGTASGTGSASAATDVWFTATQDDDVDVCLSITGNHTRYECYQAEHQQLPPNVVFDTADGVYAEAWNVVEPTFCSTTAMLSPGVNPWLEINSQGDVYVDGNLYYDCPPYTSGGRPSPTWPPSGWIVSR